MAGHTEAVDDVRDEPAIRLTQLCKQFGHVVALDGIDLEVPPGSVFGYLGPNGAGKTTSLRIMLGLIHARLAQPVSSGMIRLARA